MNNSYNDNLMISLIDIKVNVIWKYFRVGNTNIFIPYRLRERHFNDIRDNLLHGQNETFI